jgi:large conductance mechanosensitive channel
MGMLGEFREFVQRGNVVDMAVGVIIGAAFGRIVSSLVADVLMPPIGLVTGGMDFQSFRLTIGQGPKAPVTINYGVFVQTVIDFLIVAFCVFLLVKVVNRLKRPPEATPRPEPSAEVQLLGEIRDLLKRPS